MIGAVARGTVRRLARYVLAVACWAAFELGTIGGDWVTVLASQHR